jgi:hypothetical protein
VKFLLHRKGWRDLVVFVGRVLVACRRLPLVV